jgi:hypothetical protein
MRGKKSYNIRNVEAHLLNTYTPVEQQMKSQVDQFSRNMVFQTNAANIIQPTVQQRQNELINAQYGASKYTASLVSGKMFKKL